MTLTSELIEDARRYWENTCNLNPDAGIITTLKEYFEDRPGGIPTRAELDRLAFQILTTKSNKYIA